MEQEIFGKGGMSMGRFPKDCWAKNCEHFHVWDMSVDDLLCVCDLLKRECDACNEDFSYLLCPRDFMREEMREES